MKVLFVTSEAFPFAVSGGLGDVAYALPKALRHRMVGCRVVMPLYKSVPEHLRANMKFLFSTTVPVSWRRQYCGVFEAKYDGVIYYLIDNQYYFNRDSLYEHFDNAERFAFFSRAALEIIPQIDYKPDIIHCNDWQTALTPVYYNLFYRYYQGYENIKTVFTIHNIQYQGKFGFEILNDVFGIPEEAAGTVGYDDCINLMKGAIETADYVTTVSPSYAREILDPWYSHGLDGILRLREYKLCGIVNGIDTDLYNPETDPNIKANYNAETVDKKDIDKADLQSIMGLPVNPDVPLIGMVSRLVEHKGLDLVREVMHEILKRDVQICILGSGDWTFENFFNEITAQYPDKCRVYIGFKPDLAKKVYAGADIFLMPSKSEPCGLAQMVALRYGTIPIVRKTGGLGDTIQDSGDNVGNGFTFEKYDAYDMLYAIDRALQGYADKDGWKTLKKRAMSCDNSWVQSANQYIKLYKNLLGK